MNIKAVVFDLDKTLVESDKIHIDSYLMPLNKRNVNPSPEDIKSSFGTFEHVIFRKFAPSFPEKEIEEMIKERKKILLDEVNQTSKMPYSDELLKFLKGKVKLGLATGTFGEMVNKTLDLFDWKQYFDFIVVGEEIKKSRPDPEILNKTLSKLRVERNEAIYVSDSIYDVLCAKNANVKVIALGNFKEADFTAKNLMDVKNILGMLL